MKRIDTSDLGIEELRSKVKDLKDELFHLRFKFAIGQLDDHAKMTQVKRDIARCLGAVTAREKAEAGAAGA